MNAYEKAQALGLTGSDAEIVAVLKTLTNGDIPAKALGKWLGERNLLSWNGSGWFGTLQTLLDNGSITGTASDGIRQLKAVLVGPRGDGLETTSPLWAGLVFQTISGIAQASQDAAALIDSFYALDGGRPYKNLDEPTYAAQRALAITAQAEAQAAEEQAQQLSAIRARITNASALAKERIAASDTPEQQSEKWSQAWVDAV